MTVQLQQYNLTDAQKRFAEWLCEVEAKRKPRYQHEIAEELGVSRTTLTAWAKLPDLNDYRSDILWEKGKSLVPLAMETLGNLLNSKDVRTQERAARDIVERWGETRNTVSLASVMEFYKLVEKMKNKPKELNEPEESMFVNSEYNIKKQSEIMK